MSIDKYRNLIDQLCKSFRIENRNSMSRLCNLTVNQIIFTLQHGADDDPDGLLVFCDFGEPPGEQKALALQRMMEANTFTYRRNGPIFSIHPDTNHVILFTRAAISQVRLDFLVDMLINLSSYAHLWRKIFLLMDEEVESIAAFGTQQSGKKKWIEPVSIFPGVSVNFLEQDGPMSSALLAELKNARNPEDATELPHEILTVLAALEQDGLIKQAAQGASQPSEA